MTRRRSKASLIPFGGIQNSLRSGDPNPGWYPPQEIVLVYWRLSYPNLSIWIDEANSCICPITGDIFDFAQIVANGINTGNLVTSGTGLYSYNPPLGTTEFAIQKSCYVVHALEQTDWTWQFQRMAEGMTTVPYPAGRYSDLSYAVPGDDAPATQVNADGCRVAYFKAYAVENGGLDAFTLNIQYKYMGSMQPWPFDPAIKNDGHH